MNGKFWRLWPVFGQKRGTKRVYGVIVLQLYQRAHESDCSGKLRMSDQEKLKRAA
jgi:hypothetical protein